MQRSASRATKVSPVVLGPLHAVVATAVVAGFGWWLSSSDQRATPTADVLVHASGLAALVWAYAGLLTGLLAGSRPLRRRPRVRAAPQDRGARTANRPALVSLHRQLNLAVIALTLLHALLFGLGVPGGTVAIALVPGIEPVRTFAFGLGIVGLYLAVLLGPSYYLRRRIGGRAWLVAHQLAAISYAIALWHALALGPTLRCRERRDWWSGCCNSHCSS